MKFNEKVEEVLTEGKNTKIWTVVYWSGNTVIIQGTYDSEKQAKERLSELDETGDYDTENEIYIANYKLNTAVEEDIF